MIHLWRKTKTPSKAGSVWQRTKCSTTLCIHATVSLVKYAKNSVTCAYNSLCQFIPSSVSPWVHLCQHYAVFALSPACSSCLLSHSLRHSCCLDLHLPPPPAQYVPTPCSWCGPVVKIRSAFSFGQSPLRVWVVSSASSPEVTPLPSPWKDLLRAVGRHPVLKK